MRLTEVRINLCAPSSADGCRPSSGTRLRAFCSLTFDDTFVVRDAKLIEGNDGLFLAMPSRKLSDHCTACGEKNHLRAHFCNNCGKRLNNQRHLQHQDGRERAEGGPAAKRLKLHADIAHPITVSCRREIEQRTIEAYWSEVERSKQPGYMPPGLEGEDFHLFELRPEASAAAPAFQ